MNSEQVNFLLGFGIAGFAVAVLVALLALFINYFERRK